LGDFQTWIRFRNVCKHTVFVTDHIQSSPITVDIPLPTDDTKGKERLLHILSRVRPTTLNLSEWNLEGNQNLIDILGSVGHTLNTIETIKLGITDRSIDALSTFRSLKTLIIPINSIRFDYNFSNLINLTSLDLVTCDKVPILPQSLLHFLCSLTNQEVSHLIAALPQNLTVLKVLKKCDDEALYACARKFKKLKMLYVWISYDVDMPKLDGMIDPVPKMFGSLIEADLILDIPFHFVSNLFMNIQVLDIYFPKGITVKDFSIVDLIHLHTLKIGSASFSQRLFNRFVSKVTVKHPWRQNLRQLDLTDVDDTKLNKLNQLSILQGLEIYRPCPSTTLFPHLPNLLTLECKQGIDNLPILYPNLTHLTYSFLNSDMIDEKKPLTFMKSLPKLTKLKSVEIKCVIGHEDELSSTEIDEAVECLRKEGKHIIVTRKFDF
jgi:hypothetical protein